MGPNKIQVIIYVIIIMYEEYSVNTAQLCTQHNL